MNPDDYRNDGYGGKWGAAYVEPDGVGYTVIEVLPFLTGRPWDDVALAYVHALRPSTIRVNNSDCWKLDARNWRVSVLLESDDRTIKRISQEVAVGLPVGIDHGHALECALNRHPPAARRRIGHFVDGGEADMAAIEFLDQIGKKITNKPRRIEWHNGSGEHSRIGVLTVTGRPVAVTAVFRDDANHSWFVGMRL